MADKSSKKIVSPQFSMEFRTKLEELGMNPRQASAELDMAYDHVRKVYNGQIFPGRGILHDVCNKFGLDFDTMWKKVQQDRAINKGLGEALTNNDPKLLRFERFWDYLNDEERDELLAQAQRRAEAALKKQRAAANGH